MTTLSQAASQLAKGDTADGGQDLKLHQYSQQGSHYKPIDDIINNVNQIIQNVKSPLGQMQSDQPHLNSQTLHQDNIQEHLSSEVQTGQPPLNSNLRRARPAAATAQFNRVTASSSRKAVPLVARNGIASLSGSRMPAGTSNNNEEKKPSGLLWLYQLFQKKS